MIKVDSSLSGKQHNSKNAASKCSQQTSIEQKPLNQGNTKFSEQGKSQKLNKIQTQKDSLGIQILSQNPQLNAKQLNQTAYKAYQYQVSMKTENNTKFSTKQQPTQQKKNAFLKSKIAEVTNQLIQLNKGLQKSINIVNQAFGSKAQKINIQKQQKQNSQNCQSDQLKQIQLSRLQFQTPQSKVKIKKFNFKMSWQQFSKSYKFNSEFGYLVDPQVKLQKPEFEQINKIVEKLPYFKNASELSQEIKNCPAIALQAFESTEQMMKFRDMLTYIEGRYLCLERSLGKKDTQITIPYPLSKFIIDISSSLKIKVGPTAALSSNWQFNLNNQIKKINLKETQQQKPNEANSQGLTMQNLNLRYYFTEHSQEELLFLGTSIVASFHLAKVIKDCHFVNKLIEDEKTSQKEKVSIIVKTFEGIAQKWNLIYDLMINLSDHLDPEIYYHQIRPHLMGFVNVKFQNYDGLFTSGGGSAGEDPCYQIFERAMGIEISEEFTKVQIKLREGMYEAHTEMQDFFKNTSQIKAYCLENETLTEAYQNVLKTYTKMNCFHNVFIRKFILNFMPAQSHPYSQGAGGNSIMSVMNRWKVLDDKNSLGMRSNAKKPQSQDS